MGENNLVERISSRASGKKMTAEQKDQVFQMALQGISVGEISRQLNVHVLRVSGTVRALRNRGKLPSDTPSVAPTSPSYSEVPMAAPLPGHVPAPALPLPTSSGDGHLWAQATPGGAGGFSHPAQTVKYLIERFAPQNDGLVGSMTTSPTDDEIAHKYGQGAYRVTKQVPGRLPEYREFTVSAAFGQPRYPRQGVMEPPNDRTLPPGAQPRPAWARPGYPPEDASQPRPFFSRPTMRNYEDPDRDRDRERDRERTLAEFARSQSSGAESITVAVIDKLSSLQEKTLQRMEEQSKRGPDTFVRDFYQQQQAYQREISNEERGKESARQDEERKREEQRRRDDDERWRRSQSEADERHRRDMERIKEERQTLLDLEAKKLDLIREESKAREDILRKEIEANRARVEEIQGQSESRIEEMQESLKDELKRGRTTLDREYELRQKALENEHALRQEMIKLREDMIKVQGQDDLSRMLGQLVEGVKETVGKVVELKKFEMASPEDRAAAMSQHGQGNIHEIPAPISTQNSLVAPRPQKTVPAAPAAPRGVVHSPPAPSGQLNGTAERAIQEGLRNPIAQHILSEWALALKNGRDPALFVNTFMEWMKDETPSGAEGRKACAAFAQLMDNRDWPAMKKLIGPALEADTAAAFEMPSSAPFYNAFKVMVCESVRDYWQSYLLEKQNAIQARLAAQQAAQQPAGGRVAETAPEAAAAPEPEVAPAEEPAESQEEDAPSEDGDDPDEGAEAEADGGVEGNGEKATEEESPGKQPEPQGAVST
jgi:hypothetical protein